MEIESTVNDAMLAGGPVVVGVDGSEHGLDAVRLAARHAERNGNALLVIRVVEWPFIDALVEPDYSGSIESKMRTEVEHDVAAAAALAHKTAADIEVRSQLVAANAASTLVRASDHAALVVLGAHGRGVFADLLAGSVAVQVATHARCPVLVVRGDETPGGDVILGTDGSPNSAEATAFAFAEADLHGVGVTAVRAWRHPVDTGPGDFLPAVVDEHQADETAKLEATLAEWRGRYPDVPVTLRVVRGGAARPLVDASAGGQLVVVGSRGHGGFTGLLLGSVGQALLHRAECPIVIVHPHHTGDPS